MIKVRLITRDGKLVHNITMPHLHPPPEIIGWGNRVFVLSVNKSMKLQEYLIDELVYTEGLMYVVS